MELWTDKKSFGTKWTKVRKVGSGGQAHGFEVHRIKSDKSPFFMKVLKAQTDRERRARMFREAAALSTYSHPLIPTFVESNAHRHEDMDYQLFLITEFVSGSSLADFAGRPFAFSEAVRITGQLALTVDYLQNQSAVHRDIKPDNIILRDGTFEPVLVDFGMTFNIDDPTALETGDWQEFGNRFLRLPELSPYSENKRDFRSDIAFLTGVFFFCLFGRAPAVLQDEAGRLPHQLPDIDLSAVAPSAVERLARFFDRGFQPRVSDRFSNIGEFQSQLSNLNVSSENSNIASIVRELRSRYSKETIERQRRRAATLATGWRTVQNALATASAMTDGVYAPISSGDYDPNTDAPYRNMGLHHHYRQHHMRYWLKMTCRFVGTEFLISAEDVQGGNEEVLVRTDAETPDFQGFSANLLTSRLLRGVRDLPEY